MDTLRRSLATWPIPRTSQAVSPKSSTRLLLQTETRRPSTIRTTITSLTFSKITRENTGLFGVSTMWEPSVSHVSYGESEDSMHWETVAWEEREGSVISVAESMSKKSRRNSVRSHSLETHRELYSDVRDLREDMERRAQQAVLDENSAQRKLYLTEYDLEIQNLERRNAEYALIESRRELEFQRRQLLEANQWADQAQRERIHLCSELEMSSHLHQACYTRSCQEIEELRRRCYKEENGITRQKLNEYFMQQYQESRTLSLLRDQIRKLHDGLEIIEDSKIFQDPDSPSSFGSAHVSHQALIPSSSKNPSREYRMQRNTREDPSIPGSVFDCQPARRVPEESYNDSRNLAASSGFREEKELSKVGVKNHCNQYLYLAVR